MARYPRRFGSPAARAQSRAAFTALGGFLPVLGAALSSVIESNTVTLSGLVGSPALTISGGQYSKNGAAYSSAATTVTNGDTLKLRVTSSATAGATASVVATIDGTPRAFSVTTAAADTGTPTPTPTLSISGTPAAASVGSSDTFSPTISGGTPPYTLSLASGTLPPGRTVNGSARTVTGAYTNAGTYNYVLRATDAANVTADLTVNLTVSAATPSVLTYPRIAVIGPSTDANNMYGTNSPSPARNGPAASGPLVWALAKDRRARISTFTQTAAPYWAGDIKAMAGAVLADLQAQIDAAINRKNLSPSDAWVAAYNPGRNDLQDGKLLADYQAAIPGHITSLRNAGFSYIMIALLAYKPAAYGGQWVAGGAYRQEVDKINAWINSTYGSAADIKIIDSQAALLDTSTGSAMEPYANAYRSDATHLTAQGGERASAPYVTALQAIAAARPYPTNPDGLTVLPFSGTGGTLTGTGLTGTMADGWTAALETTGPTIVASQVVENGRTWQRFTVSNTEALPANGVNLRITRNSPVAIASGVRKGMRTLFRSTASSVKYGLFFALGNSSGQGDTSVPAARATLIAGVADATTNAAIGGAGTNFAGTPGFLPTAKTVAFESSSFIQGASAGSNANVDFLIIIGPGNAGDTIVFDLADPQDFNV